MAEEVSAVEARQVKDIILRIKKEVSRALVGQDELVDALIRGVLCNGHVLLEGVPGIAKTLAVRALGSASGCDVKRVQFTVDLLPTDIIGLTTYTPGRGFEVIKGPIFSNFLIADEINRSPPKCVLGDTPVILDNGEIADINKIVKKYNGKKTYSNNNEYWIVPKKTLKLLAFDPADGKIKSEEVKYLYKQKTKAPYHEVILKSGRKIKTSTIHPFFTLRNGRIGNIEAKELKKGDCVLVPKQISISGTNILNYDKKFLDKSQEIYKEIERRRILYEKIQELIKQNFNYKKIKEALNSKEEHLIKTFINTKPRYLEYSEAYFFSEAKQFGQVHGIKMPINASKELAQFMAILIAEGNVNKSNFYLTMKDKEIPELFIRLVKELFDINAKLLYDKKREMHRVAFRSDALVDLLEAVGYDPHVKARNKYVPNFILTSKDDIAREFLRLYYECDGSVSRDCIKVTTKSKRIANALSYLLLRMGFVARIGRELSRTHMGDYLYQRRFYNLRLYGGELHDFSIKIGFFTEKNNKKLAELIKNTDREKVDLIPGMHRIIRGLRKEHNITHKQFYDLTGMHAHNLENPNNALMHSRYRLSKIANVFGNENHLSKLINGDFYCDFVKENKIIQPNKEYWLYDFSMKNTHSFVAGFGGIISHNTQSALLEAMQERMVTIGKENYALPAPFFVMATQNPLEVSGVYFLPEAELDRFLFKINVGYPNPEEEIKILKQNITLQDFEKLNVKSVTSPREIIAMQNIVKKVYVSPQVEKYIIRIVHMTRKKEGYEHAKFVEWGGSPRASIGIYIAAKSEALMQGRKFVTPDDVKKVSYDVLRHRIILTYAAQVEGVNSETIVREVLNKTPVP